MAFAGRYLPSGARDAGVGGLDRRGAIVLRQKWSRGQIETRLAYLVKKLGGASAYDWTARLPAIASGEAVVLEPGGLSRFDEQRRREAARTAILYAFDLIDHDGEDLRNRPFLNPQGRAGATIARYRGGHPAQ